VEVEVADYPTLAEIRQARGRIDGWAIRTPQVKLVALDAPAEI